MISGISNVARGILKPQGTIEICSLHTTNSSGLEIRSWRPGDIPNLWEMTVYRFSKSPSSSFSDAVLGQYNSGIDGRSGEQPRGIQVIQNFIHELGHFEKFDSH